jgi:hypothetical protein
MRLALMMLIAAAAALMAPEGAAAAPMDCPAGAMFGGGGTVAMHERSAFTTSSTAFQDLPAAVLDVDQGGGCVIVKISAQVRGKSPKAARIRLTVDNNPAGNPVFLDMTSSSSGFDGKAATFMLVGVSDALITLRVQVRSSDGTEVTLRHYNMIVHYSAPGCRNRSAEAC